MMNIEVKAVQMKNFFCAVVDNAVFVLGILDLPDRTTLKNLGGETKE